jgi:purine-binding chemotaxis protein CheW
MAVGGVVKTNQYLTFRLGGEVYALDVGNAREIVEKTAITAIPKTPPWVRGVINLRGSVVPVLDLKLKLNMGATENTLSTCVIIVEFLLEGELSVVGILADSVVEVFDLGTAKIEPPPKFGTRLSTEYIRGVGRRGEQLYIVLDADRIFSDFEFEEAQSLAEQVPVMDAAPAAAGAQV